MKPLASSATLVTALCLTVSLPAQAEFWDSVKKQADKARSAIESLDNAASQASKASKHLDREPSSTEQENEQQRAQTPPQEHTRKVAPSRVIQPATRAPQYDRSQVLEIQKRLNTLGYDIGKPDGIYGPGTKSGIKAFQRDRGLKVDARPTTELQAKLETTVKAEQTPSIEQADVAAIEPTPNMAETITIAIDPDGIAFTNLDVMGVKLGMSDEDVVRILADHGYSSKQKHFPRETVQVTGLTVRLPYEKKPQLIPDTSRISMRTLQRQEGDGKVTLDQIRVTYEYQPNEHRALVVDRTIAYQKGKGPAVEALIDGLQQKYGKPSLNRINRINRNTEMVWAYDMSGDRLFMDDEEMKKNPLTYNQGKIECGSMASMSIGGISHADGYYNERAFEQLKCSGILYVRISGDQFGASGLRMALENHTQKRTSFRNTRQYVENYKKRAVAEREREAAVRSKPAF